MGPMLEQIPKWCFTLWFPNKIVPTGTRPRILCLQPGRGARKLRYGAIRPIAAGEVLTFSYVGNGMNLPAPQEMLMGVGHSTGLVSKGHHKNAWSFRNPEGP